jgi:hypothetical protein
LEDLEEKKKAKNKEKRKCNKQAPFCCWQLSASAQWVHWNLQTHSKLKHSSAATTQTTGQCWFEHPFFLLFFFF